MPRIQRRVNVWARAQLMVGYASNWLGPEWQVAVERPGYPLLLGSRSAPGCRGEAGVSSAPGYPPTSASASARSSSQWLQQGLYLSPLVVHWLTPSILWRLYAQWRSAVGQPRCWSCYPAMWSSWRTRHVSKHLIKGRPLERERQPPLVFLSWEPHEQYEKAKKYDTERWTPRLVGVQYAIVE